MISAAEGGSIALDGVSKRYGAQTVVDGVTLSIAAGEFFSLLGPSGSGKTTTLMTVAGFTEPDAGTVLLGGRDVTRVSPRHRGLGMVFQNYALFPHLDVFENIAFPLRIRGTPGAEIERRVAEVLAMVRLDGLARRRIGQLSGGQQQRVALARATVFRPPIVLMDEPLGALDKGLRYQMQVEIKEIQRRLGMTVLYVTHDQEEAMNMSDRIAIMDGGRIVQVGPPREVYDRPRTAFAGRFLGEATLLRGRVEGGAFRTEAGPVLPLARPAGAGRWLVLRPERIALHSDAAPDGRVALPGRVARVSFLGGTVRTAVEAGLGELLLADAPNGAGPVLSPGDAVTASWHAADAVLLDSD